MSYHLPKGIEPRIGKKLEKIMQVLMEGIHNNAPERIISQIPEETLQADHIVVIAIGKNAVIYAKQLITKIESRASKSEIESFIFQAQGYTSISEIDHPNSHLFNLPHPLPSQDTFKKTGQLIQYLKNDNQHGVIHFIVTGGGSSCFALPEPEFTSDQYSSIINSALIHGFDISQINLIRSLIDRVKGGKFLNFCKQYPVYTWAISDVDTNDIKVIASGPTSPCIELYDQTLEWLKLKLADLNNPTNLASLTNRLENVCNYYKNNQERYSHQILLTRDDLLYVVKEGFRGLGYNAIIETSNLNDDVEACVERFHKSILEHQDHENTILIWSGEPTITLSQEAVVSGAGGRVSAICCLIAEKLEDHDNILFLGMATDARDGTSPEPIYFVTKETSRHLRPLGGARKVIFQGNSGYALSSLNYGISIESTDLNLNDIYLAFIS